jgi:predicted nucleic acid-binding protein
MRRVIIDTNALIRYLGIEIDNNQINLTTDARKIINDGLNSGSHILFLNAISLIEIWSNLPFSSDQSISDSFRLSVHQLYSEPNLRVISLDVDTLKQYSALQQSSLLREHDKIIYASGMVFECDTLITVDGDVKEFNRSNGEKFEII